MVRVTGVLKKDFPLLAVLTKFLFIKVDFKDIPVLSVKSLSFGLGHQNVAQRTGKIVFNEVCTKSNVLNTLDKSVGMLCYGFCVLHTIVV